jgi:hypothetical protein
LNTALVTTGLKPLTLGSTELFEAAPVLDLQPWNLAGGSAQLILADPIGSLTTITGTIGASGYSVTAPWTVAGPVGNWTRAWRLVDATGIIQVSLPIVFEVQSSPV